MPLTASAGTRERRTTRPRWRKRSPSYAKRAAASRNTPLPLRANIAQFFGLLLAFLLAACTTSAAPEPPTAPPEPAPPEALVRQFYQEWSTTEGNPIQLRAYDNTDYLTRGCTPSRRLQWQ
jgi:hypothetical protein